MELVKGLLALLGALLIFTLGLLAWRQQLLDKRRFEVAEEVLVMYARLAAQIRILRQRNDLHGINEWIRAQLERKRVREDQHAIWSYEWDMVRREWLYRIPEKKQEAFNEVYRNFTATVALARMYLSEDIVAGLVRIEGVYNSVETAARVLVKINPEPPIDPEAQREYGEPSSHWPYDPDYEPSSAEALDKEKLHFPIRFRALQPPDATDISIDTAEAYLALACKPYTDQGPYQFLYSFLATLLPVQVKQWWKGPT